ncbi:hypothetical protein [Nonomuraea wenchangensis]|uniref:Transmembrane transport protein n=1 Tax=Nonomuraea wenchangensis TaxID=568860 RepID=A0A1I0LWY4_9ACTN|nr:hypothetical protein [Nonomuraea wenchangensis]SEU47074.1 hypothetical protein SAMN05421811_12811 [Nonomuraea wenchangensis]
MNDEPNLSAEELIGRLSPVLSPWRRLRGVAALVGGLAGAVCAGSLWATEPAALPGRTRLAFAVFTLVCLAWAGYGAWLVTRRTPLLALDRVIAGWFALAASIATTVVIVVAAVQRGAGLAPALATGAVVTAVSAVLVVRAHVRRAALLRRKRELTGRGAPPADPLDGTDPPRGR